MLHSRITLVSKPPILLLPILYPLPLTPHHRPLLLAVLLRLLPPFLPWLSQGSSMEGRRILQCWRSPCQEHWTTSLSLISSSRPHLHPGIQSQLIFLFPYSWILCSAFWSHPLRVWHSLPWCHARQRRHCHFRQAGPIFLWTLYLLSFLVRSLLWLCRDQHLS